MANYFDRFNQGFGNFLNPNPPPANPYMDSLMLDDSLKALIKQQQDAQRQNMGSMFRTGLGTALLEMGAPRRTPGLDLTPLSRIIGSINQAAQGQGAMGNAFALPMQALQFQALQQKVESEKKLPIKVLNDNDYSGIKKIDDLRAKIQSNNDYLKANFPSNVNAGAIIKRNDNLLNNIGKAQLLENINPEFFEGLTQGQDVLSSVNALANIKITDFGQFIGDAVKNNKYNTLANKLEVQPKLISDYFLNEKDSGKLETATNLLNNFRLADESLKQITDSFSKFTSEESQGFDYRKALEEPLLRKQEAAQEFINFISGQPFVDETTQADGPELGVLPEVIIEEREKIDDSIQQEQPEIEQTPRTTYPEKFLNNTDIKYKIVPDKAIEDSLKAKIDIQFKNYNQNRKDKEFLKMRKVAVNDIAAATNLINKQDKILTIVNSLLNEAGRKTIKAGTIGGKSRFAAGKERALEFFGAESFEKENAYDDAIARLESEKFFEVIASLKAQGKGTGLGALSDAEGRRFNELLGKLSRGGGLLSESVIINNLQEIKKTILKSKTNILTVFEDAYESPLVEI